MTLCDLPHVYTGRSNALLYVFTLSGSGSGDPNYESTSVALKGPYSQYEEVKLESNPAYAEVVKCTFATEPQYEECGGGMTNSRGVAMEESPAYQSVGVEHSTREEEPTYQNV